MGIHWNVFKITNVPQAKKLILTNAAAEPQKVAETPGGGGERGGRQLLTEDTDEEGTSQKRLGKIKVDVGKFELTRWEREKEREENIIFHPSEKFCEKKKCLQRLLSETKSIQIYCFNLSFDSGGMAFQPLTSALN